MLLTVPIAAVSLAVRFRRARGLERQQLRWLACAAGLASVGAVLALAGLLTLLAVVNQTAQPTRASLWLRPQGAASATDGTAAHRFLIRR